MIIKGKSRAGPRQLGVYLSTPGENEKIQTFEVRGTVAQDVRGAIAEMDAYALGTRCEKPLYHAQINPEPPHRLTPDQCRESADILEAELGLNGHARIIILHEKQSRDGVDRQHLHIVWSRVDLDHMRTVSDSWTYPKHEAAAREMERRFGHDRVQGVHVERDGVKRPNRSPSRKELNQEKRTGIRGKEIKKEITECYQSSDGPEAFKAAIAEKGYLLARGDFRDYIIVDRAGGIHSLARRIDGVEAKELREFMSSMDPHSVPSSEQAKEIAAERERKMKEFEAQQDERRLQKAYGRGEDYVSQSRAALNEHKDRQEKVNEDFAKAKAESFDPKEQRYAEFARSTGQRKSSDFEDDPSRQRKTPGGGHSRGR